MTTPTLEENRDFLVTCIQKVRSIIQHRCRCRQCGEQCSWTDDICQVCGTQDPIRLPMKWLACGSAILVGLLLIVIIHLSSRTEKGSRRVMRREMTRPDCRRPPAVLAARMVSHWKPVRCVAFP